MGRHPRNKGKTEAAYGIVARRENGATPWGDEAHFDGWYFIREWAEGVESTST